MTASLSELLQESVESVKLREHHALQDLLAKTDNRVVLFGAGTLGRRAVSLLREIGVVPLALCDNNQSRWGSQLDGIPLLSPAEAAHHFGADSTFIVTIWNDRHWFSETMDQLTSLGCRTVSSYAPIFWRFPDRFMELLLLNEPPHRLYLDSKRVLEAEKLWADSVSLETFRANIRWRALGDASTMPKRPVENTYFPKDLFQLGPEDIFLDCGAYDGDSIIQMARHSCDLFKFAYAIEADSISYDRLCRLVESQTGLSHRVLPIRAAVGSSRGTLYFESNGSVTSKASDRGDAVDCIPIDELFEDKQLTMIKMDIEGAEYEALQGAQKTLQRDQPILAICVYHRQADLWKIPLLVREVLPHHNLFLRAYEGDGFQTVLFAVPPNRLSMTPSVRGAL